MNIRELIEQFEIQGAYCIKTWNDDDYTIHASGIDFECEHWDIKEDIFEKKITYMYAVDGTLIIEVE